MARGFAIHNAPTDHGGFIPATQMRSSQMGNRFVCAGDGHYCPKCQCWSKVIKSHDHVLFDGKAVAYAGDKLTCGAKILPQQSHVVGDSGRQGSTELSSLGLRNNFIKKEIFDEQIQVVLNNSFSSLFSGLYYKLKVGEQVIEGTLDSDGKTSRFETNSSEQVSEFELFFKDSIKYFHELEGEE